MFPTRLYHPALAGTPPEEGNWNYLGGLFQTPLYHPALAGTPPEEENWNYLGGLFQTPLYHLHPCRRGFQYLVIPAKAGIQWVHNTFPCQRE